MGISCFFIQASEATIGRFHRRVSPLPSFGGFDVRRSAACIGPCEELGLEFTFAQQRKASMGPVFEG